MQQPAGPVQNNVQVEQFKQQYEREYQNKLAELLKREQAA
jgi:hypothetical protein